MSKAERLVRELLAVVRDHKLHTGQHEAVVAEATRFLADVNKKPETPLEKLIRGEAPPEPEPEKLVVDDVTVTPLDDEDDEAEADETEADETDDGETDDDDTPNEE
jgi:hypothetical protein